VVEKGVGIEGSAPPGLPALGITMLAKAVEQDIEPINKAKLIERIRGECLKGLGKILMEKSKGELKFRRVWSRLFFLSTLILS
jgi:hypothetical protein